MKKILLAAASAALLAGLATSANAAITVVAADPDDLYGTGLGAYGQVMLQDFDSISNGNTSFVGNVIEYPDEFEDPIVTSAPPPYSGGVTIGGAAVPVDPTNYASVLGGSSATFSVLSGSLRSFSFYLGSPDTYNKLTFNLAGGGTQVMEGEQIWGGFPPARATVRSVTACTTISVAPACRRSRSNPARTRSSSTVWPARSRNRPPGP